MIDTETVMPRVARQQTRSFTTAVRSLVEAEEAEAGSTMKAIYLESKTGAGTGHRDGRRAATDSVALNLMA